MTSKVDRKISVSRSDAGRLRALLESCKGSVGGVTAQYMSALKAELDGARVLPDGGLPGDVVGLGSTVEITDLDTGGRMRLMLVVPEQATGNGCVSVLSPLGMALFGYRKDDTVEWGPVSRLLRYRIDDVKRNGTAATGWLRDKEDQRE